MAIFFTKTSTSKKLLLFLCIFVLSGILSFLAVIKHRLYMSPELHSVNSTNDHTADTELNKKPLTKLFAYYVLTEKCLAPYYLESIALGNSSRCDVYVNSYKEKCDDKNIPKHITHIFQKTTWSTGRNLLFYHVKESGKRYSYHIFLDDDAIPIHTDHVIEFRKANPNANFLSAYLSSDKGLKEGIYWRKEGRSAWRQFEEDLLQDSPSFAVTNFVRGDLETRLLYQDHWKQVCAKGKEMPWVVPTFFLDEMFIAFHEEAMPILLPYTTMFEHLNWVASGILHIFRARALLFRTGVVNYKYTVINHTHRRYPQNFLPNDFLSQYLAGHGKDMKGLIDERDLDWTNYDSWVKWQAAFIHTKAMCTVPLKFPVWKHYRLS